MTKDFIGFIEIGGGTKAEPASINLDPVHGAGQWKRLAQDTPWPAADGSVGGIRASHVMEHIPAGAPRIDVMNEAHRVLQDDAEFEIIVPFVIGSFEIPSAETKLPSLLWPAIADPTHVSYWCAESFAYFDRTMLPDADYGIKPWRTVSLGIRDGWEGHWVGVPVKE